MSRSGKMGVARALLVAVALGACARASPRGALGPPPVLPEPRRAARVVPQPEWYWEPVDLELRGAPRRIDLPIDEPSLVRVEGATRLWVDLGAEGRERLRRDGLLVLGSTGAPRVRMGELYTYLRAQRVPYLVTLDALAYAEHLAFELALAEVDDAMLAPELESLLGKLEGRLLREQRGASVEIVQALRLARGIVAVARALLDGASSVSDPDLGPVVAQELALVGAHAGISRSPLLGVPLDYARLAAPEGSGRPGAFRALAWLGSAPLQFVAESEAKGAVVGVATARLHTRAAMLLARVAGRELDPALHASWSRVARLLGFLWGPSDDLSPTELAELAASLGVTLEDPKHVGNVLAVDRLRHRAARGRQPLVFDGGGGAGRAGIGMRLFGGHAPADAVALASLTSAASAPLASGGAPVAAVRPLPSTLDLAVWSGAPEARASLHENSGDAWLGYEAALARATGARPGDDEGPARHASVYGSSLDVVMTWLSPRDPFARALASPAAHRAAIESALAAWTFARHAGQPFARPRPSSPRAARDLEVRGAPLLAFVEPAPEVIAGMVATVAQMRRGLSVLARLPAGSSAMASLLEVEDLLRGALRAATQQANDEPVSPEDAASLASFPARLARLEELSSGMVPVVAEVMVDATGQRVLTSATGEVEETVTVAREPVTGRLLLVVGAHVAHHELLEPRGQASSDLSHRARWSPAPGGERPEVAPPARGAYTATFRVVR